LNYQRKGNSSVGQIMNVSLDTLSLMASALNVPDKYFYVKCPKCGLASFFNLLDEKTNCLVWKEYGGCGENTTIDLLPLRETTEFQSMVNTRLKEWVPIHKNIERLAGGLPIPSNPFIVSDLRLVRLENGNYVLFHKDEKIFDTFGINPKLKHGIIKEIV